jgi:alanine-glyoxylate transaminase/serine-glyoxylate transaminase/serine-pyruvate transaminase
MPVNMGGSLAAAARTAGYDAAMTTLPPAAAPAARIPGLRLLHAPGPTRVPDEVLHAMSRQPTDLADPRVPALIASCEQGLLKLAGAPADSRAFFYAANGHGGWEAVIANLLVPGGTVLVPGSGQFSNSWAEHVQAFGGTALRTPWTEGHPIDPAAVQAALEADRGHRIAAVFVVHTDTAAGTTCDLAAMRRALDAARHPALLVVDAVASLAAAPLDMAALGVDVVMGASQKGLMLPPGMAFCVVGPRGMAAARANPAPRLYWCWVRRDSELQYRKFCGTPPLAHLAGLEAALALIETEGLAQVHARHARLAAATHAAVEAWGSAGALRLFTRVPAARSASVTAIEVLAPGTDPEAIRAVARERFQVAVAGGLGPLAGRVFRIGHLGDMNEAMLLGALAGVQAALGVLGVPHGRDGVAAAIDRLAAGTA